MIKKIIKHVNLKEFLKEVKKEGIKVEKNKKYHKKVKKLCNNACAYIYTKLIENLDYRLLYNLEVHTGTFIIDKKLHKHTWIEYFENNLRYVIDITLCQFDEKIENIYTQEKDDRFQTLESINFTNFEEIITFFKKI
jgi:hypothetical protein